jgi:hypothetical protein
MNWSQLIFPLLVFLIVGVLTGLVIFYWDSVFGARTLALKKRLEEFSSNNQDELNLKKIGNSISINSPTWFLSLKEKYPKLEFIEIRVPFYNQLPCKSNTSNFSLSFFLPNVGWFWFRTNFTFIDIDCNVA